MTVKLWVRMGSSVNSGYRAPTPGELVGVVRHLPDVEEMEALWMEDAEFGELIHYLPVDGPGRYLVVELGQ